MSFSRIYYCMAAIIPSTVACAAFLGACGNDRGTFDEQAGPFADASLDTSDCPRQCSLDGRSIIDSCTGTMIEACAADLACGGAKCLPPCAAATEDRSSNGCEFYFQPPPSYLGRPPFCNALYVVNTSVQPVDVTLELEGKALDLSRAMFRTNPGSADLTPHVGPIPAGESVILFVSDAAPELPRVGDFVACPAGVTPAIYLTKTSRYTGIGSSFRLVSTVPVAATAIFPFGGAPTYLPAATLLLPVGTWAKENMLVNGWEANLDSPAAQIVAAEDGTEVTIDPKRDIQSGEGVQPARARHPVTYHLNKGQHLQLVQDEELTGSIVSSNKPTSIFGAHTCALVPSNEGPCDSLIQQIPAFQQWGSEYVGVGYRPRMGNEHEPMPYRIVAARDGTRLDYDPEIPPGAPTTMNAGEMAMFRTGTGDAFVVRTQDAEHPIYVAAYMSGALNFAARGDPEFVNVVPTGQYLSSYSFFADPMYAETSLVVVRSKVRGEFKDVWLECAGNLTEWKPVGTRGDYEYIRVDLQRDRGPGQTFGTSVCQTGLQRMRSDGPFTATLWGWDIWASYAYPSGMAQRKLVDTPLLPIR